MAFIHSTTVPLLKLTAALAKAAGLSFSVSAGIIGVLAVAGKRSHKRAEVMLLMFWHSCPIMTSQSCDLVLSVLCLREVKMHAAGGRQPWNEDIVCCAGVWETFGGN